MPAFLATHTHTFYDGTKVTKQCIMTFNDYDKPDLVREKTSIFTHPETGETFSHRFSFTKDDDEDQKSSTSDAPGGEYVGCVRLRSY
jgi:hypothetical protein